MRVNRSHLASAMAILWCLLYLSGPASASESAQTGGDGSQRVELLDHAGGLVTAAVPLGGGTVLAAEGSALVVMTIAPEASQVLDRRDLGHGAILDLARCADSLCALTVEGLVTLSASDTIHVPATVNFAPGGGQAMAVQVDLVAIAARQAGLRVLRVGPGGTLGVPAVLPLPGLAIDVALDRANNRVYVAAGDAGVIVVEIGDQPTVITTIQTIRPADSVAVVGRLLAVGSARRVVLIDPAAGGQAAVGAYAPLTDGRRIIIDGDYAYIADGQDGLKILWLTAPERPVQVYGEVDRPAEDVAVVGDTAYVVGTDGLRIYDIGSRYRPLQIANLTLPAVPKGITVVDTRAFISLGDLGIEVVDIANQSSPEPGRVIGLGGVASSSVYSDGLLYAAAGDAGLAVIDVSVPGGEALLSTLPLPGPALDVGMRADALFVAAGEAGLVAIDIQRRRLPVIASVLPPAAGKSNRAITIQGKRGYVTQDDGFIITDVSFAKSMGVLGTMRTPANHVAANDIYLYALDGDRVNIFDARATAEPIYLRAYRGLRGASRIAIDGTRAFVTSAVDGPDLVVLDLAASDAPIELDNEGETGHTYHVHAESGFALLPAGLSGLRAFSLTEGGALRPEGVYDAMGDAAHLANTGGGVLIGGQQGWALSDFQTASILKTAPGQPVRALAADGDTAFLSREDGSLEAYLLGGTSTRPVAEGQTPGPAGGLAISLEYLFVAAPDGLAIYNRANLTEAQQIDLPSPPTGVALANNIAYLPMRDGSLAMVDVGDPTGGLRIQGSAATQRPAALMRGADGRIYTVADVEIRRLALGNMTDPGAVLVGTLPYVGGEGMFLGDLLAVLTPGEALRFYDPNSLGSGAVVFFGEIALAAQDITPGWPLAYAAYGDGGLGIVDVPNRQVSPPFFNEPVNAVYQDGNNLYAVGSSLTVWDTNQPDQPRQIASLPLDFSGRHIDPAPDGKWLVSTESGLAIVGRDGDNLALIGSAALPGPANRAIQIGERGYVALHSGGLMVIDLRDPANPSPLFTLTSQSGRFVRDIMQLDDTHLLASWDDRVDIIDIGSPAPPPQLAGTFLLDGQAAGIRITPDGRHAALPMLGDGVAILDLADPHKPALVGRVDTPGQALAAQIDGGLLYLADGTCGLRIFDVANPAAPHEMGFWRGGYASDLLLMPDASVILASGSQLARLRYNPAAPALPPPVPQNPDPPADDSNAPIDLTLKWGPPADPCNPLKYDVYFGQEDNPPLLGSVTGTPQLEVPQLAPHGAYTWHVTVTDTQGDQINGPMWRFTTAGADYPNGFAPSPPLFLTWIEDHPLVSIGLILLFLAIPGFLVLRGLARQSGIGFPGGQTRHEGDIPDWYEAGRDVGEHPEEPPQEYNQPPGE